VEYAAQGEAEESSTPLTASIRGMVLPSVAQFASVRPWTRALSINMLTFGTEIVLCGGNDSSMTSISH
jgi:hypothetical protein